ncbi:MAG: hypothetical protein RRY33_07630 [Alistipes sp.]
MSIKDEDQISQSETTFVLIGSVNFNPKKQSLRIYDDMSFAFVTNYS